MTYTNDGGPAFPSYNPIMSSPPAEGMTLRDWFAGMALQGMLCHCKIPFQLEPTPEDESGNRDYPKAAYQLADSMLKERDK